MSEAMTSGDIEDVLSSIRRLVSDDLRPAPRPVRAALVTEEPDTLILTPALRVLPVGSVPLPQAAAGGAQDHPTGMAPGNAAAQAGMDNSMEPASADPAGDDAPADRQAQDPAADPWAADAACPAAQDAHSETTGLIGAMSPQARCSGAEPRRSEGVIGSIGAAMGTVATEWEPETGDPAPGLASGLAPDPAPDPGRVTRLSWIDVADDAADPVDTPPPRFVHRAEPPPQEDRGADPSPLVGITDDVLDEALLRDIVRAVLREELQGHLGERITRNIRKLVRAEINRSLTLRDYE